MTKKYTISAFKGAMVLAYLAAVVVVVRVIIPLEGIWVVAALIAVALFVYLSFSKPSITHVMLAVILYMFSQTTISRMDATSGELARVLALVILLVAAFRCQRANLRSEFGGLGPLLSFGSISYVLAIFMHGPNVETLTNTLSFTLSCLVIIFAAARVRPTMSEAGIERALFLALVLSVLWAITQPGEAFRAGRLEGIFVNANTLGFFAALGLLISVTHQHTRFRSLLFIISGTSLVASGSRSPLLALAVAMIVGSVVAIVRLEKGNVRFLIFTALGSLIGLAVRNLVVTQDLDILRTNDSRAGGTEYALRIAGSHPWLGIGYGNSQIEIASTPLRLMAEGGLIAFMCVVCVYVLILKSASAHSWQAVTFAIFGIVHSIFEGWYFAGGSGLFFAYWLIYSSVWRASTGSNTDGYPVATKNAGIRWSGQRRRRHEGDLSAPS